jgi:hypothetical protein
VCKIHCTSALVEQKANLLYIFVQLLQQAGAEQNFMKSIIMVGEMWVCSHNVEMRLQT